MWLFRSSERPVTVHFTSSNHAPICTVLLSANTCISELYNQPFVSDQHTLMYFIVPVSRTGKDIRICDLVDSFRSAEQSFLQSRTTECDCIKTVHQKQKHIASNSSLTFHVIQDMSMQDMWKTKFNLVLRKLSVLRVLFSQGKYM